MRTILAGLVRCYQLFLSPLFPGCCRFEPSCSEYSRQAFMRLGVLRGGYLTAKRLLRCHPLCAGGHDPVPDR